MYSLYAPMWDTNDILRKLLSEVLGYNNDEIKLLEIEHYDRNIVNNLTLEQAKIITEIFLDNDFQLYLNDGSGLDNIIYWKKDLQVNLNHNYPKSHYCEKPLISRDQLADLSIAKKIDKPIQGAIFNSKPTITCPYCKSTDTKKITTTGRIFSVRLFGFGSSKIGKQFHCNKCKADF